jgi:hypothetical protein
MALRPITTNAIDQVMNPQDQLVADMRDKNALVPVNRCPSEVLGRIFLYCRPYTWHEPSLPLKSFIGLTHVCYLWRISALGFPALWNLVPCKRADTTDWMLARAKSSPLVIRGLGYAQGGRERKKDNDLLRDTARIQVLAITEQVSHLQNAIAIALQKPAPALEVFHYARAIPYGGLGGFGVDLPPLLFSGHFPNLRELHLRHVTVTGAKLHLRQLRSVTLNSPIPAATVPMMLESLQDMPNLEHLVLQRMHQSIPVAESSQETSHAELKIILPRLEFLSVDGQEEWILQLLSSLEAPVLKYLHVPVAMASILSAYSFRNLRLVRSYLDAHRTAITSCHVFQEGQSLEISGMRTTSVGSGTGFSIAPEAAFKFACRTMLDDPRDGMKILSREHSEMAVTVWASAIARDFQNLTSLVVRIRNYGKRSEQLVLDDKVWPAFLQALPYSLNEIHVFEFQRGRILPVCRLFTAVLICVLGDLQDLSPSHAISPLRGVPLPGLRRIVLHNAAFTSSTARPGGRYMDNKVILPLLSACLHARAARGSTLERLELVHCTSDNDEDFEDLRKQNLVKETLLQDCRGRPV